MEKPTRIRALVDFTFPFLNRIESSLNLHYRQDLSTLDHKTVTNTSSLVHNCYDLWEAVFLSSYTFSTSQEVQLFSSGVVSSCSELRFTNITNNTPRTTVQSRTQEGHSYHPHPIFQIQSEVLSDRLYPHPPLTL